MVRFGYCITYVENVAACLEFFENAFGLKRRFLHDSGTYGELDTGATVLAFAAMELGEAHFPDGFERRDPWGWRWRWFAMMWPPRINPR